MWRLCITHKHRPGKNSMAIGASYVTKSVRVFEMKYSGVYLSNDKVSSSQNINKVTCRCTHTQEEWMPMLCACPVISERKGSLLFRKYEHKNGYNLSITCDAPYKIRQWISPDLSQLVNLLDKTPWLGPKYQPCLSLEHLHIERMRHMVLVRIYYTLGSRNVRNTDMVVTKIGIPMAKNLCAFIRSKEHIQLSVPKAEDEHFLCLLLPCKSCLLQLTADSEPWPPKLQD